VSATAPPSILHSHHNYITLFNQFKFTITNDIVRRRDISFFFSLGYRRRLRYVVPPRSILLLLSLPNVIQEIFEIGTLTWPHLDLFQLWHFTEARKKIPLLIINHGSRRQEKSNAPKVKATPRPSNTLLLPSVQATI
jgi:hypothetical protein